MTLIRLAYNNLAWLLAERKIKLDEAVIWAKKAADLAPQLPHVQDTLGMGLPVTR